MGAQFWRVSADIDSNRWPLADVDLPNTEALDLMDATHRRLSRGRVYDWKPSILRLSRPRFADMQPEVRGLRLCSSRFRDVIDSVRAPDDDIQWLEETVQGPTGESRPYHVLHFPTVPEMLDSRHSTFGPAGVIRQVFRANALAHRVVIPPPDYPAMDFILADAGRHALEQHAATDGVLFRRALVIE